MVDKQFLKTLHDTFPPGHIIDLLNSLRREVIFQKIQSLIADDSNPKSFFEELRIDLEKNLCHPLLLPTAIAGCLVGDSTFEKLLTDFLNGTTSIDFSQSWVRVSTDSFNSTDQLKRFFEYEQHYYSGVYAFLLDSFKPGGKNMFAHSFHSPLINQLIEKGYETAGINSFKKKHGFSPHILRLNAWTVFNAPMAYINGLNSERKAAVLFGYGFDKNSFWHNTNDLSENNFKQAKRALNHALTLPDREMREKAIENLRISEYLLRRSQRLYWWNPCEADAHDSSEDMVEAVLEGLSRKHNDNIEKSDAETT